MNPLGNREIKERSESAHRQNKITTKNAQSLRPTTLRLRGLSLSVPLFKESRRKGKFGLERESELGRDLKHSETMQHSGLPRGVSPLRIVGLLLLQLQLILSVSAFQNSHVDQHERDVFFCGICERLVIPVIQRAVKTSHDSQHTLQSVENALSTVIEAIEADPEAKDDDVREYIEHLLWDTHIMRQYSAIQRTYHKYPEFGNMIDQLIDVVVCGCGKHNGEDRMLDKLLQRHAVNVKREYEEHGGWDHVVGHHHYDEHRMQDFKPNDGPEQGAVVEEGSDGMGQAAPAGGMAGGGGGMPGGGGMAGMMNGMEL